MSTDQQQKTLLEDFQHYLQQTEMTLPGQGAQPDLHTLFSEMSGLKAEVKAESRQFKSTLDSLNGALETVQDDNQALSKALAESKVQLQQQQQMMMQAMLLDMVDMYERLSIAMEVLQNYRPSTRLFHKSTQKDVRFVNRYKEGQQMILRRFEQILQRQQVRVIECVGQVFDPQLMNAVETVQDPQFENGVVVEELRKGFCRHDQVLRLADVKVNKLL